MDPDSSLPPSRLRRSGAAGPGARPRPSGASSSGGRRTPARAGVAVAVTDGRGNRVVDGGLGRWLRRVAPRNVRGELGIALVSDARMRALNRSYRRKDYATDVLSFIPDEFEAVALVDAGPRPLGDLVIATGVAQRQAREAGHAYQTELRVLALHGLLHLLGYDHEHAEDKGRMARIEARLRRKGGLKAGLIGRNARQAPAPSVRARRVVPRSGARARARAALGPREQQE